MTFRPSWSDLYAVFREYNALCFAGLLTRPDLVVEEMEAEWGYCFREAGDPSVSFGVADEFPSRDTFERIVLHEMVHLYQLQVLLIEPCHDLMFRMVESIALKSLGKPWARDYVNDPHVIPDPPEAQPDK